MQWCLNIKDVTDNRWRFSTHNLTEHCALSYPVVLIILIVILVTSFLLLVVLISPLCFWMSSPHVVCTLVEMETIRYGFQCCLTCPAHLVVNPMFLFTFLFWWPCMLCPRLLCDYTPTYWNARTTCDPMRALRKFYMYILRPTVM